MQNWQTEAFWHYGVALYKYNRVKKLCLDLQDNAGLNVNLLLLCCYLQQHKVSLQVADFKPLQQSIFRLDRALQKLRVKRRQKDKQSQAYQQLLTAELTLEQAQQERLIQCLQQLHLSSQQQAIGHNLLSYALSSNLTCCEETIHKLALMQQLAEEFNANYQGDAE